MSKEITLNEAAAAWGRGETVEAEHNGEWRPVAPFGSIPHAFAYHSPEVFNRSFGRFRMASVPVPHIRSWELGEVPIGALIKHDQWVNDGFRYAICGVEKNQVVWMTSTGPGKQTFHELSADSRWRHSVDGGKTWHPCGVKVTS